MRVAIRRWWWLAAGLVVATVLGSLILPRSYRARLAFVLEGGSSAGGVAAVVAQLGVPFPTLDAARSPQFYADLLRSPSLARRLLTTRYDPDGPGPDSGATLVALLDPPGRSDEERLDRGIEMLGRRLHASVNLKTGVVTLLVDARTPWLARDVAAAALDAVTEFDIKTRQSQGRAERQFLEARLEMAHRELRDSEDRMQAFLERNRDYGSSPRLVFQHQRLERDLVTRRELYATLERAYEQARIAEVRDTPALSVVDAPVLPPRPQDRRLLLRSVLAALTGLGGIAAIGFWSAVGGRGR